MTGKLDGKLTLTVHKASDIKSTAWIGKQDPFVRLSAGTESFDTKVCKGGDRAPAFNQSFLFNLDGKQEDVLHVMMYSSETLGSTPLSRVDVKLTELVAKSGPQWHTLLDVNNFKLNGGSIQMTAVFQSNHPTPAAAPAPAPAAAPAAQIVYVPATQVVYAAPPVYVAATQWSCPRCTLDNRIANTRCEVCNAPRP